MPTMWVSEVSQDFDCTDKRCISKKLDKEVDDDEWMNGRYKMEWEKSHKKFEEEAAND